MVLFFKDKNELIYAVDSPKDLDSKNISKLEWLFVGKYIDSNQISSKEFLGPKKASNLSNVFSFTFVLGIKYGYS